MNPILAEMTLGGLGVINAATVGVSPASSPGTAGVAPAGCAYAPATKSFVCPTRTANGVTVTQSYTLYDAAGGPQSQADSLTTASVRLLTTITGTETVSDSGLSGTLATNLNDDETLSGVNTGHFTLNGMLTSSVSGTITDDTGPQAFGISETARTANVVLAPPGPAGSAIRWPLSGTVTVDLTITDGAGSDATTLTAREVFTFNGTTTVGIVITIAGQSSTCTWDFAGTAGPVCAVSSRALVPASAGGGHRLAESLLASSVTARTRALLRVNAASLSGVRDRRR